MSDSFIFPDDSGDLAGDPAGSTPPRADASPGGPGFGDAGFGDAGLDGPAADAAPFGSIDFGTDLDGPAFDGGFGGSDFGTSDFGAPSFASADFAGPDGAGSDFDDAPFGAAESGFGGSFDAGFDAPFGSGSDDDGPAEIAAPAFGTLAAGALAEDGVHFGGDPFAIPDVDPGDFEGFDGPLLDDDGAVDVSFAEAAPLVAAEAGGDAPKPKRAKASARSKEGLILGVHVTPKQVFGVLVRPSAEGYEPLRQFVRQRTEGGPGGAAISPDQVDEVPLEVAAAEDASVQFGGVGEIDFSAEFAGLGVAVDGFETVGASAPVAALSKPIIFELRDILEECAQAGFARPALAFAVDAPDVAYAELTVPPEKKKAKAKKSKKADDDEPPADPSTAPVKRERLVELVPELGVAYDKDRVAFVPMTPRDGLRRFMAVVPTGSEPVAESVEMLREQSAHRKTAVQTLQAEVPLLVGLVRLTSAPEPHENTALVRVGAEDTIVLLLTGGQIHHYEPMQSVTAFDGPDTICSRVLLQQDVQGVGMVHNVVIVAEEREKELVQGFSAFYPEARVETLREGMARIGLVGPYGPLAPVLVEAAGAAVAGHRARTKNNPFDEANLLPPALMKRKRALDLSFSWHTIVVTMLLFLSVLFFSYLYVAQKGEIADAEQRLAEYPPEAQMSVPQLQARIDSLRGRQASLTAALVAMDSLLIDTDRWTQTMIRATRAAAQTGGIWIEEWAPAESDVTLTGYATSRDRVVSLAQRLEATIEEVTFQAVRDYPVYAYRIRFTQPPELPQITRVMRDQVEAPEELVPMPLDGLDAPAR